MDTRTKILTAEEAGALGRGSEQVVLATGYFDVLLAAHLRDLERVRESLPEDAVLLVALGTPEQPLLDGRARAEVVAALAVVDYVVSLEKQQMERLLPVFPEQRRVRLEAAHQERMRELIEHVHRRQSQ